MNIEEFKRLINSDEAFETDLIVKDMDHNTLTYKQIYIGDQFYQFFIENGKHIYVKRITKTRIVIFTWILYKIVTVTVKFCDIKFHYS